MPSLTEYIGTVQVKKQKQRFITEREAERIYQQYGRLLDEIDSVTRAEVRKQTERMKGGPPPSPSPNT